MREKVEFTAVWDDDLNSLLESLGVLAEMTAGKANCVNCGRQVNIDNLGTIIPTIELVNFTCDDAFCVQSVTSREPVTSSG